MIGRLFATTIFLVLTTYDVQAQSLGIDLSATGSDGATSSRIIQLVVAITVLSVAPGLLIMLTTFTRFTIVLSFLRTGLGLQTSPANLVLISLALFMTFYVMSPTFDKAWQNGISPLLENKITEKEAFAKVAQPFRAFMVANVRPKDLSLFQDLARERFGENTTAYDLETIEMRILVPAFMISELRRGFEIGFLIILPFLVIDMVTAMITMSMGMMMLPPTVLSLPLKILFFVLIDGWNLLVGGLVRSVV